MQNCERHAVLVATEEAGDRLDKYLSQALAGKVEALSRVRIQGLIADGFVQRSLGDTLVPATGASYRVKAGERYIVAVPPAADPLPLAQEIPLDIRYEDEHLLVVMKPANMVVHPAPGSPDATLVNALIAHCGETLSGIGGEKRPGIVHRLDKETSGLMVVAKNDKAHQGLSAQFAAHGRDGKLTRAYRALVWGDLRTAEGTVETRIGRSTHNRRKMAVVQTGGREAITHYRRLRRFGKPEVLVSEVECRLETGRTHQIRVHLTHLGHPLLGDPVYGGSQRTRRAKLPPEAQAALEHMHRQALHAFELGFEHPVTGEPMHFTADLPPDMAQLTEALGAI